MILGLAGTAQLIRIMRANLLDELRKPYVVTARASGLSEWRVILKYPVRVALNPFASTIGYLLPYVVSGSIIVSLVLGLPTVGPLLLRALIAQDMFLAGTIVLLLGVMTVIGTLLSDLLLMWIDPRIRAGGTAIATLAPDAPAVAVGAVAEERVAVATQWQLMWWRFRKHRLAMVGAVIVLLVLRRGALRRLPRLRRPGASEAQRSLIAPQRIQLVRRRAASRRTSTASAGERDPMTFKRVYTPDPAQKLPVTFFAPRLRVPALRLHPDRPPPDRRRGRPRRRRRSSCSAPTCRDATCGRA